MTANLVPAAQYLRMSAESQQYSLKNQADAIEKYANEHSIEIVKTYSDEARSGLLLRNRNGLKQLLKDVVEGLIRFRVVLVYDVSRWGRFQDADESAHYEYLCKSSGIPVYYCAEQFANDNGIFGSLAKALKRTMAGEYSRELSVKVRAGQFRLAKLGYKMGGHTPIGFRRQLLDLNGSPKQLLSFGQHKSVVNERVTLVPGPREEVATVERIFHEFADGQRSLKAIANGLNKDGIPFTTGHTWTAGTVTNVLKNVKYVGVQAWGRTTEYLGAPVVKLPQDRWAVCPNAFEPIISPELFYRAQERFANFTYNLSDEQLLERLKQLLLKHGRLSNAIIDKSRSCPGASTYYQRFGGLLNVYRQLGYDPSVEVKNFITLRQRRYIIRNSLIANLLQAFPADLQEVRLNKRFRPLLRYRRTGLLIAVVLAHYCKRTRQGYWYLHAPKVERKRTAIVAFLNEQNSEIQSIRIFSSLRFFRLRIRGEKAEKWLNSGQLLKDISEFLTVLKLARYAP